MHWNCPHCQTALAVNDELMSSGWNFSKCYQCGGFALVRRAELNLIKIDQAPPGQKILTPEAYAQKVPPLMNADATRHLARHALPLRTHAPDVPTMSPPVEVAAEALLPPPLTEATEITESAEVLQAKIDEELLADGSVMAMAMARTRLDRWLPVAITLAAVLTAASGVYVFVQGQSLWQKTQARPAVKQPSTPLASAASVIAIPPARTDQVPTQMAAPEKPAIQVPVAPMPAFRMSIKLRVKNASLRSGPGMEFPVLGIANPDFEYTVNDWNDRWFQVALPDTEIPGSVLRTAWIRNDLVSRVER